MGQTRSHQTAVTTSSLAQAPTSSRERMATKLHRSSARRRPRRKRTAQQAKQTKSLSAPSSYPSVEVIRSSKSLASCRKLPSLRMPTKNFNRMVLCKKTTWLKTCHLLQLQLLQCPKCPKCQLWSIRLNNKNSRLLTQSWWWTTFRSTWFSNLRLKMCNSKMTKIMNLRLLDRFDSLLISKQKNRSKINARSPSAWRSFFTHIYNHFNINLLK